MELLGEARGQRRAADEVEHVSEIMEPVGRGHARGELELDEPRQRQEREFPPAQCCRRWVRKRDRLWLTISRKTAGAEDVDLDVVLGIDELSGPRRALGIALSKVFALETLQI